MLFSQISCAHVPSVNEKKRRKEKSYGKKKTKTKKGDLREKKKSNAFLLENSPLRSSTPEFSGKTCIKVLGCTVFKTCTRCFVDCLNRCCFGGVMVGGNTETKAFFCFGSLSFFLCVLLAPVLTLAWNF